MSQQLSPFAQAVLQAYWKAEEESQQQGVGAALRAAAQLSVPDDSNGYYVFLPGLLAIADELAGKPVIPDRDESSES